MRNVISGELDCDPGFFLRDVCLSTFHINTPGEFLDIVATKPEAEGHSL